MSNLLQRDSCPGLVHLIDTIYDRVELLKQAGLVSFLAGLSFVQDHCENSAELAQHMDSTIDHNKRFIFASFDKRSMGCGSLKDRSVSTYKRKMAELRKANPCTFSKIAAPYEREMLEFWKEEIEKFGSLVVLDKETDLGSLHYIKALLSYYLESIGFRSDQTSGDREHVTYSKELTGSYRLSWKIDRALLRKPIGTASVMRVIGTDEVMPLPASGPELDIWLALYQTSTADVSKRVLGLRFEWLFPIREGPFGGRCYHAFYNATELRALIAIYTIMYKLISIDFEYAMREMIDLFPEGTAS